MVEKMHLAVFKNGQGFQARRFFDDEVDEAMLKNALFVITETLSLADLNAWQAMYERAQRMAKRYGLEHVDNLDPFPFKTFST